MSEQELAAKMNEALAKINPDRRKFLGILLAGVAVAPLLNSASLAAEDKTGVQQGKVFPKTQTTAKGNTAIKDGSANTIKSTDQSNKTIKFWDKSSSGNSIKLTNANEHKNSSDIWLKNNAGIKNTNSAIKNTNTGAIKNTNDSIKLTNANTQLKSASKPPKSQSQPIQH